MGRVKTRRRRPRLRKSITVMSSKQFFSFEWNELCCVGEIGGELCTTLKWYTAPQRETTPKPSTFDALFAFLFRADILLFAAILCFFLLCAQEQHKRRTLNYCEHVWWWIDIRGWALIRCCQSSFSIVISWMLETDGRCVWLAAAHTRKKVSMMMIATLQVDSSDGHGVEHRQKK